LLGEYIYIIDKKIYKEETLITKIKKIIKR
jgi:hypothetical protein